jgi:signal transduction histidine kinase
LQGPYQPSVDSPHATLKKAPVAIAVLEYTCARPDALKARILIERQVAQMTRLVDDLLDLSRIRHGQLTLQRKRVDLCVVVAHATATVALTM